MRLAAVTRFRRRAADVHGHRAATTAAGVTLPPRRAADAGQLASVYAYAIAGGIPTLITGLTTAEGYVYTTSQSVALSTASTVPIRGGYTRVSAATVAAAVKAYTIALAKGIAIRQVKARGGVEAKLVNAWAARQHVAPVTAA